MVVQTPGGGITGRCRPAKNMEVRVLDIGLTILGMGGALLVVVMAAIARNWEMAQVGLLLAIFVVLVHRNRR